MTDSSSGAPRSRRRVLCSIVVLSVVAVIGLHVLAAQSQVIALEEIVHVSGHRFRAQLPEGLPAGDHHNAAKVWIKCSPAFLLEDGVRIGKAHTIHQQITDDGRGGFSHWIDTINFASSDNSSPLHNGRRYALAFPNL